MIDGGAIYAKTEKGQEELENRTGGLNLRGRRVLIMIDGKRTVNEVRSVNAGNEIDEAMQALIAAGYVALAAPGAAAAAVAAATAAVPASSGFRPLDPEHDAESVGRARNFMINTIKTFVGTVGTSSILNRLDQCQTQEALRAEFDAWQTAIASSRDGRREVDGLREKLLKVI